MQVVLEGRCAKCNRLLFERSVEDQGTTHDLSVICPDCIKVIAVPFMPLISIRPIVQESV